MKKLIVIGGNRIGSEYPIKSLIKLNKKYNLKIYYLTERTHLKKKINTNNNFEYLLKKNKISYHILNNYKNIFPLLKKITKNNFSDFYCLLLNSIFIIKKDIINKFKNRIFNIHIGKLPNQRGAAVQSWRIMSRGKKSAVTLHRVTRNIDVGNIVLEKKVNCKNLRTEKEFYKKVNIIEKKVLNEFINILIKNIKFQNERSQNEKNSEYMPRLETTIHSYINWSWKAEDIVSFISAFDNPHPGARTFIENKKIILKSASLLKAKKKFHPFQYGIIFRKFKNKYYIASNNGVILVNIFLNKFGKKIDKNFVGKRCYTPLKHLDEAMQIRAIHLPSNIKLAK